MNKVIHYCWFGGKPLNDLGKKCIESWKKFFPDYEIKEWNESNFDINCCDYVKEAYEAKKWAFVSDYARFKILYENGGIYFDIDVEVIKSFDDILSYGAFFGCESLKGGKISVNSGLGCGVEPYNSFYKEVLDDYEKSHFLGEDGQFNLYTVVERITDLLVLKGFKSVNKIQIIDGITLYPKEYFSPLDYCSNKLKITKNTYSIHHYVASWHNDEQSYAKKKLQTLSRFMPKKLADKVATLLAIKKYQGTKALIKKILKK